MSAFRDPKLMAFSHTWGINALYLDSSEMLETLDRGMKRGAGSEPYYRHLVDGLSAEGEILPVGSLVRVTLSDEKAAQLLSRYQRGKAIHIAPGWNLKGDSGHRVSITLFQHRGHHYLKYSNKGYSLVDREPDELFYCKNAPTIDVLKKLASTDSSYIDSLSIKHNAVMRLEPEEAAKKLAELGGVATDLGTTLIYRPHWLKGQKVGNCMSKSADAYIHGKIFKLAYADFFDRQFPPEVVREDGARAGAGAASVDARMVEFDHSKFSSVAQTAYQQTKESMAARRRKSRLTQLRSFLADLSTNLNSDDPVRVAFTEAQLVAVMNKASTKYFKLRAKQAQMEEDKESKDKWVARNYGKDCVDDDYQDISNGRWLSEIKIKKSFYKSASNEIRTWVDALGPEQFALKSRLFTLLTFNRYQYSRLESRKAASKTISVFFKKEERAGLLDEAYLNQLMTSYGVDAGHKGFKKSISPKLVGLLASDESTEAKVELTARCDTSLPLRDIAVSSDKPPGAEETKTPDGS